MDLQLLVNENQSIKIVPSIEEELRLAGFDLGFSDVEDQWFNQLVFTWKTWKKSITVEHQIEHFFRCSDQPYKVALAAIIKCNNFKDCKPKSLPYFIIETLENWAQKVNIVPDESLQWPAFQIAIQQRNAQFLSLMVKTFKLSTLKQNILECVKDMIENGNYKQASQVIIAMELFNEIPVQDLLFPLILQDHTSMVDEYLVHSPSQVKPFLMFLDKLLDRNCSIRDFVQNYIEEHKVIEVKYEKLHHKPLGKLVARLCNKFKLPIDTCKNLSKNRITGGLRYLIYQKYLEHKVSSSVWDDLVKDALGNNPESATEFIDLLAEYDRKEALKWAEHLNIPQTEYPLILKNIPVDESNVEDWDAASSSSQQYHQLSLKMNQIIMIDNTEKFYNLMTVDLKDFHIVGIDCEWKPSFGAVQSTVALIQVSTVDTVYLIDTMVLNKREYISFWCMFSKLLINNAEVIKVGFGLENDLKEIKATVIGLHNIKVKGEGLLDISALWKNLINVGLIMPFNPERRNASLSSLVQACFSYPLAKSEQCSNWELRPLRDTQVQYAALDAYVLMEVYMCLQEICRKQNIDFDHICAEIMSEGKPKIPKKTKVADRIQSSVANKSNITYRVHDVKFFLDPKISQMMAYLRYCGIDTQLISSSMLWHDVINLAISDERLILLNKIKISPTVNYPQSSIFVVNNSTVKEELLRIIKNFRINVYSEDLCTRCIYCNCVDLKELSQAEVKHIYDTLKSYQDTNYYDDYEEIDNFLSESENEDDLYQPIENIEVSSCSDKKNCVTGKGIPIQISEVPESYVSSISKALLCESCGILCFIDYGQLKQVSDVVNSLNLPSNCGVSPSTASCFT